MSDEKQEKHKEPTNEQLANFLMVYAKQIPELDGMRLSAPVLESLMSQNPRLRAGALWHHRRFQEQLTELHQNMHAGTLQCEHELKSGKQCPNRNEPGSMYCGLHRGEHEAT